MLDLNTVSHVCSVFINPKDQYVIGSITEDIDDIEAAILFVPNHYTIPITPSGETLVYSTDSSSFLHLSPSCVSGPVRRFYNSVCGVNTTCYDCV